MIGGNCWTIGGREGQKAANDWQQVVNKWGNNDQNDGRGKNDQNDSGDLMHVGIDAVEGIDEFITIDSGAAESVAPPGWCDAPVTETEGSARGAYFIAANGTHIPGRGGSESESTPTAARGRLTSIYARWRSRWPQ